jgi:hypothetical protein
MCLHRPRSSLISSTISVDPVGISNIQGLLIWRETNPVRTPKSISHCSHVSRSWVEAIDVRAELRFGAEALLGTVDGVCEPDATVCVHDYVVGGVELQAVEVIEQRTGGVGRVRRHKNQAGS